MKVEKNRLGSISISQDTIKSLIIEETILNLGKNYLKSIFLTNSKGKKISRFNPASGIKLKLNKNSDHSIKDMEISICIILKFGKSIKQTTDTLGETVKEIVEKNFGISVSKIKFIITGIESKTVVKKDIEVVKIYAVRK